MPLASRPRLLSAGPAFEFREEDRSDDPVHPTGLSSLGLVSLEAGGLEGHAETAVFSVDLDEPRDLVEIHEVLTALPGRARRLIQRVLVVRRRGASHLDLDDGHPVAFLDSSAADVGSTDSIL